MRALYSAVNVRRRARAAGSGFSSTTPVSARSFKDAVVIVTGNGDPVSPCSDDRLLPLSHLTLTPGPRS